MTDKSPEQRTQLGSDVLSGALSFQHAGVAAASMAARTGSQVSFAIDLAGRATGPIGGAATVAYGLATEGPAGGVKAAVSFTAGYVAAAGFILWQANPTYCRRNGKSVDVARSAVTTCSISEMNCAIQ